MKFPIRHRWTGEVLFEAELDASFEKEPFRVQLGAASDGRGAPNNEAAA